MVIDIRTRLEQRNAQNERRAEQMERAAAEQLRHSEQSAELLRTTARVPKADRALLARNLGKMLERLEQRSQPISVRALFLEAFGADSGESKYKKRRRYIHLDRDQSGEDPATATLCATGSDFLRLAEALARLTPDPQSAPDRLLKLARFRLLKNTSYSQRSDHDRHRTLEGEEEFKRQIEAIRRTTTRDGKLDWLRDWCMSYSVLIDDGDEGIGRARISDSGGGRLQFDIEEDDLSYGHGVFANPYTPKVRLCSIRSRLGVAGYLPFDVPVCDIAALGERDAVIKALDFLVARNTADKEEPEKIWDALDNARDWVSLEHSGRPFEGMFQPWVKRIVELELRFSPSRDQWLVCLVLRLPRVLTGWPEIRHDLALSSGWIDPEQSSARPCLYLGGEMGIDESVVAMPMDPERNDASSRRYCAFTTSAYMSYPVDQDHLLGDEIKESVLMLPQHRAMTFAFADAQSSAHRLEYAFEAHADRFSPAPPGSLAGAILRNLAYSPAPQRLDQMLLSDARARVDNVKQLAAASEAEYYQAVERDSE